MSQLRKVYQSLVYKTLDIYIVVNGKRKLIQFRGGSLEPRINGSYTTTDPDEIEVLDKDSANGICFKCSYSEGEPERKEEPKQEPEKTNTETKLKEISGISSLQDARNYLLANLTGLVPSKVNTTNMVKKVAADNGLVFTDLQ